MFGRWTFPIYSGSSCNFALPLAQFTRCGEPFELPELRGIDRHQWFVQSHLFGCH